MTDLEDDPDRDLVSYLRIFWRHKSLILLTMLVAVGGVLGVDSQRTRIYKGTATILFVSQNYAAPGEVAPLQPNDVLTDIELVKGASVYLHADKILGRAIPPATVSQVGTTNTASIVVFSPDPVFAARSANAYADAYIADSQRQYVLAQESAATQLQKQITSLQSQVSSVESQISSTKDAGSLTTLNAQLGNLEGQLQALQTQRSQVQADVAQTPSGGRIVTTATVNRIPTSPKPVTDGILFGLLGLAVGIALALLLERADDRIRSKEALEEVTAGLPTLGLIPNVEEWRDEHASYLVTTQHPKSPPAEAYRGLRTSVQFLGFDESLKLLQVTSPMAVEGKTTTAANLAVTMAQTGQRIILVSCDLRRPRIHDFFGLSNSVGFTSVIVGDASLDDAVLKVPGYEALYVLPSGPIPPNPSELLGSARASEIFSALSEKADLVLIDSPPVMPITDASVLAGHVDGVLLVVVGGTSTRKDVRRSLETLGRVGARVVGVVLNKASETDSYGYYRYAYSEKSGGPSSASAPVPIKAALNGTGSNPSLPQSRRERRRSG